MNAGSIHSQVFSIAAILRMDHDLLSPYYSFPLFVADYELHNRKIPAINFIHNGELVTDPVKLNQSGKEMVRQAFGCLRQKGGTWIHHQLQGNAAYIFVQAAKGDSIAEKILDPVFMEQACVLLNTAILEVAIPHTGIILARAGDNTTGTEEFDARVQEEFSRIQTIPLSDLKFIYTGDRITSVKDRMTAQSTQNTSATTPPEAKEGELLLITEMPVFTGDFFYKVEIGAPDDTSLLDLCERTLFHLLNKGIVLHRFLGIIEFVVNRVTNPYTPEQDDKLTQFWGLLQQAKPLQELVGRLRRNIELSIISGEYIASGEGHRKKYFKITYQR